MRKIILSLISLILLNSAFSQNTFPASGKVGIGTISPQSALHISGVDYYNSIITLERDYDGWGSTVKFLSKDGNSAIPNSRPIGVVLFSGATSGSTSSNAAKIQAFSTESWTSTKSGTRLGFYTTQNGTLGFDSSPRMIINHNGNVGIGIPTPSYRLHVNGSAAKPGGGSWTNASDSRLKQDIRPFTDGLELIKAIKPVWYRYNGIAGLPSDKEYVGIIAQEMQKIAPYTVGTFTHEDEDGNSTEYLDYNGSAVTYMLINAIKEQQVQLEAQQQEIEALKDLIYGSDTKAPHTATKSVGSEEQSVLTGFALEQNVPNPFDKTTVISAVVPEQVQQAKIVVYNLQGLELESYMILTRGRVTVAIDGGRFPSGMYVYALIADDRLIDTKKMILTK